MILEFLAGTDQGVKLKTKRRKNSARHNGRDDIIKIWNYKRHEEKRWPGRGCASEFLKLFRHPAAPPFAELFEIIIRQV